MKRVLIVYTCLIFCHTASLLGQQVLDRSQSSDGFILRNNNISILGSDRNGFLWLASQEEILRFDGANYKPVPHEVNRVLLDDDKQVQASCFSPDNRHIWIGTSAGLYRFDTGTYRIEQMEEFAGQRITGIIEDGFGNLWLNSSKGILVYSKTRDRIGEVISPSDKNLSGSRTNTLSVDPDHNLWVPGRNMILRLQNEHGLLARDYFEQPDPVRVDTFFMGDKLPQSLYVDSYSVAWVWDRRQLRAIRLPIPEQPEEYEYELRNTEISSLYVDSKGNVWIGCRSKGNICLVRDRDGRILEEKRFLMGQYNDDLSNTTNRIYEDAYENLWIGTRDGLYLIKPERISPFYTLRSDIDNNNSLSHNTITGVFVDKEQTLWVGSALGLNKVTFNDSPEKNYTIERFFDNRPYVDRVQDNKIECITDDDTGVLWLGTKGKITFFDPASNAYLRREEIEGQLKGNAFVRSFTKDGQGNIWMAFETGGIWVYREEIKKAFPVPLLHERDSLEKGSAVAVDKRGFIWAGSRNNGIFRFRYDAGQQMPVAAGHFRLGEEGQNFPVKCLYVDPYNNIWAGSSQGLFRYNEEKEGFEQQLLPAQNRSPYIAGLIADRWGNLWIATSSGIYRFNISSGSIEFKELNSGEFVRPDYVFNAAINPNGDVFMSGISGLTYFNPEEILPDTSYCSVFITDFRVLNKTVPIGDGILGQDINLCEKITLSHRDYQFSFDFSTLNFPESDRVSYAYLLEGFDHDWIHVGADRRYVSYTNLPAGNYTFKLKSTNASGVWLDNIRQLNIHIKPSPWNAWWSYCIYAALMLGLFATGFKMWYSWTRVKARQEMDEWRIEFFNNVSYSFKTPLTLMQTPLKTLIEQEERLSGEEKSELFRVMQRNSKRLSMLIDQLMEFRRIDRGEACLNLIESDVVPFLREICAPFQDLAESHKINFSFRSNVPSMMLVYDPSKLETVLFQLLSNALKFTGEGGSIIVNCYFDTKDYKFWIEISDTGIGIKPGHLQKIFERFWLSDHSRKREMRGAGIGLSLTRDYIELHHGEIFVESTEGKGSSFRFCLLPGKSHFRSQEIERTGQIPKPSEYIRNHIEIMEENDDRTHDDQRKLPRIFVTDEDPDIRKFLKKILSGQYRVNTYSTTEGVYEDICRSRPDLVISGVTFDSPNDGLELCKRIKANPDINHIPIILLSSRSGEEEKQAGYQSGADAYITKPFDVSFLRTRIGQLLQFREMIKEKAKRELIVSPKEMKLQSADEKFLGQMMKIIEMNISDENFTVDLFAEKMNISASMLYRRVKKLTHYSPVEFIRTVRMKRAAQLLESQALSISEVAFQAGFSDNRYFSTCFKKEYGITPSEYQQKHKLQKLQD